MSRVLGELEGESRITYPFKVNIISELHVLSVDAKNLETTSWIRDTNVYFSVEATEPSEGGIDRVGSVCCSHHDDVGARLETIHESEELRNDTTFDFSVSLQANKEAMSILKCTYTV